MLLAFGSGGGRPILHIRRSNLASFGPRAALVFRREVDCAPGDEVSLGRHIRQGVRDGPPLRPRQAAGANPGD